MKKLFAILLITLSLNVFAWSGTVTSVGPNGTTTVHKDPDTGVKTITLPNGDVIIKEPISAQTGTPWHNWEVDRRSSTTQSDVTITINHPQEISAAPMHVIQPTVITAIGGGMGGGGGDIGTSASGQAHELEEVVLTDSSWIENGVEFWKNNKEI